MRNYLIISIYRDENNLFIIPFAHGREDRWYIETHWDISVYELGSFILEAKKHASIEEAKPVPEDDHLRTPTWKVISKYKSRNAFVKNNKHCLVDFEENHIEIISKLLSEEFNGQYGKACKEICLPITAVAEEIGGAVIDVLDSVDKYYLQNKYKTYKNTIETIELLDNSKLNITRPSDKHFVDGFDHGAAELYTSYDYTTKDDGEVSAVFFLGLGTELDSDLSRENIMAKWQEMFGIADFFEIDEENKGIFSVRVEFRNKETHKISWFLKQSDDLLLECGMEVYKPGRRRKLDEKLSTQFEEFAAECEFA